MKIGNYFKASAGAKRLVEAQVFFIYYAIVFSNYAPDKNILP